MSINCCRYGRALASFFLFSFFLSAPLGLVGQTNEGAGATTEVLETPDVPRGFYTGLYTGMIYFVNSQDRALFGEGWLVGLKAGYDIFKFLQVEARLGFSGHNSSPQGVSNPGIPRSFMAYQAQGFIRGGYPVMRRLTLTADIGGGLWYTRPNQKANIGTASRGMMTGGLGIQYFIRMRGLSMGLEPSMSVIQDLEGPIATMAGYVRYTF